jgi:flagellar biogenesis protein FliO
MDESGPGQDPDEAEQDRRRTNLIMLVVAVALVVAGVWLVNKLVDMRKMQECAESGRHNCAPIEVPERRTW